MGWYATVESAGDAKQRADEEYPGRGEAGFNVPLSFAVRLTGFAASPWCDY